MPIPEIQSLVFAKWSKSHDQRWKSQTRDSRKEQADKTSIGHQTRFEEESLKLPNSPRTLRSFPVESNANSLQILERSAGCFSSRRLGQRRFDDRFGTLKTRIPFRKTVCESSMTKGLSNESHKLSRHLLSHKGPDVAKSMAKSGCKDLVGAIERLSMPRLTASSFEALEDFSIAAP